MAVVLTIIGVVVFFALHRARELDPGSARVRARRHIPPRAPDRAEGAGPDLPDPDHRQDGPRRAPHGDAQHPASGGDHARQRAGLRERGLLLPRRQPERRDRPDRELPRRHVADRADDPAGRARPRRARHAPVGAGPLERRAPAHHRRADRALGDQGHDGRDQGRRDPADDAAGDGPAGGSGARAPRQDHRRRGRVPGLRQARAGRRHDRQGAGRDPAPLSADAGRGRLGAKLDDDLPRPDRPVPTVPRGSAQCRPQRRHRAPPPKWPHPSFGSTRSRACASCWRRSAPSGR